MVRCCDRGFGDRLYLPPHSIRAERAPRGCPDPDRRSGKAPGHSKDARCDGDDDRCCGAGCPGQATDESLYDIKELTKDGPVVLVFIKDGCPCSEAAQPFFNLLFDAYGKHARFFGIFDGDVTVARKWAKHNLVGFPILSDPDLRTVHEYKAENSAYVALIAKGGRIEKLWPGYSAEMLADAAARLARLTGFIAKPIDVRMRRRR